MFCPNSLPLSFWLNDRGYGRKGQIGNHPTRRGDSSQEYHKRDKERSPVPTYTSGVVSGSRSLRSE